MPKLVAHNGYYLYNYLPSLPASITFATLFLVLTVLHAIRTFRSRTWFVIPFIVGGILETIGYAFRAVGYYHSGSEIPFIIQSITLLIAPAFFAASIYMTLGRLIRSVRGEKHSLLSTTKLTKVFVLGDVLSFLIQATGGGLYASGNNGAKLGHAIILVGLAVQIVMFGLFVAVAVVWQRRMARNPTGESINQGQIGWYTWKRMLYVLYATSLFILVRSAFRIIEYGVGMHGYPLQHEWTLYVFDAALMFSTMVIFFIWFPSQIKVHQPQIIADTKTSEEIAMV